MAGMGADPAMIAGMGSIAAGIVLATFGAIPKRSVRHGSDAATGFEAPPDGSLDRWHVIVMLVLALGLVIDVMKPATLGFVLPGLSREYDVGPEIAALLPLVALLGTAVGSFLWGWLADVHGRRVSILLSTLVFVATSICGAMPSFPLNLMMCFLMGASAGGMLPVVYTLLTEIMPPRHRSWVLVLIGGVGMAGGYLAASATAHAFEPLFGWRVLWLQGFPTGLLLLLLSRFIPESPRFLYEQGRTEELARMERRFGIVRRLPLRTSAGSGAPSPTRTRLTLALTLAALAWSFVNFGLLLWLPSELQARGYSSSLATAILASSALVALPTIMIVAWTYSRWSSKWTLVGTTIVTALGLIGALLPPRWIAEPPVLVALIALLIVGNNGMIAVLLPYTAENYPLGRRARATGIVAASSKLGGVAVQCLALVGLVPTLGATALALIFPMAGAATMIAWAGRETRGRSLQELEA